MRKLILSMFLLVFVNQSYASEFCLDRYDGQIRQVNAELSDKLRRLNVLEDLIVNVRKDKDAISKEMVKIIQTDPSLSIPANRERMKHLADQSDILDRRETEAKNEAYQIQDRVFALKGNIPANLAGELRGCVEAVKPANVGVNLVIQAIAALSTGGASFLLPPKTLYVDMGQVLNGYPLGGSESVVNQARESALNALGIGGNNDIGNVVRDPGRVIRCIFGC